MQGAVLNLRATIGIIIAAALAAAVLLFFASGPDSPDKVTPSSDVRAAPQAARASAHGFVQPTMPESAGSSAPLNREQSVSALAKRAASSSEDRAQALSELYDAVIFCDAEAVFTRDPKGAGPSATEQQKRRFVQRQQFFRRFCDTTAQSAASVLDQLMELGPEDPVMQASTLFEMDEKTAASIGVPVAERLANQSAAPAALEKAFWFLSTRGLDLPAARSIRPPASVSGREAKVEAQRLAVMMVGCQVRGGCGPGGFVTQKWCAECMGTQSLEQSWQRQYSPDTLEYARQLANAIIKATPTHP